MGWVEHPQRQQVVNEMHLRRWPTLSVPTMLIQILRMVDQDEWEAQANAIDALPDAKLDPSDNPRQTSGVLPGGVPFVLERFSEASAITVILPMVVGEHLAFPEEVCRWARDLPGRVIRATKIFIFKSVSDAEMYLPELKMKTSDVISCYVGTEAKVRLWSDFRIGEDGWGHLLIAAERMDPGDLTRLVQRLQELGNYRNLALLGLPVARLYWNDLDRAELELAELAAEVASPDSIDDVLLEKVTGVSLGLIQAVAATRFRMAATQAYARIAIERLHEIGTLPVSGYPSLLDFTERRLRPAVRTCDAYAQRLSELALSADRFAALLRTRIETRIENQNALLLKSMRNISIAQLRMQHFVEGLSVIAISYYVVSLFSHFVKAYELYFGEHLVEMSESIAVPISLVGFGLFIANKRKKLGKSRYET
ncbi:DUF3422 domain-containing protein [Sphingobium xenophagum]